MRRVVIGVLAALSVLAIPTMATASTQQSNEVAADVWQSPTGNIRCGYGNQIGVICYTRSNGRAAFLQSFGRAYIGTTGGATFPAGRVLRYGRTWSISTFRCRSQVSGMECWSTHTGHGFHIDRSRAYRW